MAQILLIDDDAVFRTVTRAMLESGGHDVLDAGDGFAADRLLEANTPDLVVTDLLMPDKDGIEEILSLLRERPGVPILAISGGGSLDARSLLGMAHRMGAGATLAKPFDAPTLLAAVGRLLKAA